MQALLRIGAALFFALIGFGLLAESSRFGLLRSRPLCLLIVVPLALLCLWGYRRATEPEDKP
jgi:hypothetical protein